MDSQQFREYGKELVDVLADYIDNIRDRDVLPPVEPGYLIKRLPNEAPEQPEDWKDVMHDFNDKIMPGITHWQSPHFHAFFPTGHSFASILGSMLSDGLGVLGLNWLASPACTELEVVTTNWLGKLFGLPEEFLNSGSGSGGGIIQGSASESTLMALLVARNKIMRVLKSNDPNIDEEKVKPKLIAYTSDQCNSSVEKAGVLGSMKIRLLETDENGSLRGEILKKAINEDKALGLIPCYIIVTLGTTPTCAFDNLNELAPICKTENMWLHVDAAYAGAAFICPEYRYLMKGIESADSIVVNVNKWLPVHFDCSLMWVRNSFDIMRTFDVQRTYLNDMKDLGIPDYRHWQIPLGRRFRSLKLWTVMRIHGAEGLRKHIRTQVSLALYFAKLVRDDDRFVVEPEPSMGLVCFRLKEGDNSTMQMLEILTKRKKIFMVAGTFKNKYVIRFAICSRLTTQEDINYSWNEIKEVADLILYTDKINGNLNKIPY